MFWSFCCSNQLTKSWLSLRFKIRNAEVPAQFYDDHNFRCDKTRVTHCFPLLSPATNTRIHYYISSQMRTSDVRWGRVRECHNWSVSPWHQLPKVRGKSKYNQIHCYNLSHGLNNYWSSPYGSCMIYPFNGAIKRVFIVFNICLGC